MKTIKTQINGNNLKLLIPNYYLEGSNLYSVSENLLLRWMELHHEEESGCNYDY
jgi:hypothetical protein